ncbi:S-formylglutathione hydrolase-like isoform X3 [Colletes latitarsis]|uniref:S-formylglutathione hydrolase-like isoform X3 n=1 Tax=Colletes latitarsis TaxID=2605962 RepID=UPI0040361F94
MDYVTSAAPASHVAANLGLAVSERTVRRRLREAGLHCHRSARKIPSASRKLFTVTIHNSIGYKGTQHCLQMPDITEVSSSKVFGGWQKVYSHYSSELQCKMNFGIFLPAQIEEESVPVIYWLSGLMCTEANFIQKAGAQKYASEHGLILVAPDTSPRNVNIPGEDDSWDFGSGAGFYVDATNEPWKKNYRMYSYITKELPTLINDKFPVLPHKQSIMGHSMGGHGALICALKNPGLYKTVSVFAPICNPILCPWGKKAFAGYFGGPETNAVWKDWDATELAKKYNGPPLEILIDQGKEDMFLKDGQLLPENFVTAVKDAKLSLTLRFQEGYDHSYFFITTFIEDHIKHHVKYLRT